MVNRLYIEQIAYKMNRAKIDGYEDIVKSSEALSWIVEKIESYLNKCLNVEDGRCSLTWKHDECRTLMEILYDLTQEDKYKEKEWLFDPNQKLLWE